MRVVVDDDLKKVIKQLHLLERQVLDGNVQPFELRRPLQDLLEHRHLDRSAEPDVRFDRYLGLLLALNRQLELITRFDSDYWDGWLAERVALATIPTSSRHVQSVKDLEIFYVDFGSAEENLEMYWKIIAGNQSRSWRYDGLISDTEHLRLGPNTKKYEPGIHRIRINLVANWEPQNGRSVLQVRERAAANSESLAHAEVLAAYAWHDELVRQMDGTNLPYANLAGFEATVPGHDPWAHVPYLLWSRVGREVGLRAGWAGHVNQGWAAPVLRES